MKSVIVGCGGISAVHASVLGASDYTQFVACADIRPERAQARAEQFGARAYTDYIEMLETEKPDVLHICTPHYLHVPMALEAVSRSIHVFMEKPAAISPEQLAQLEQADASGKARIGVCFQNRFNPTTKRLQALLAQPETGRPLGARAFVTWMRKEPYYTQSGWRGSLATEGGSVLINQSIHTLDLLVRLLGKPAAVEAGSANHHLKGVIETEDTLEAYITFANGANALFYATTAYSEDSPVLLEVSCEGCTVRFEGDDVIVRGRDGAISKETLNAETAIGKSYWGSGHAACIGEFYASLRSGEPFLNDVASVGDTMRLMFAIYRSAREGKPVEM